MRACVARARPCVGVALPIYVQRPQPPSKNAVCNFLQLREEIEEMDLRVLRRLISPLMFCALSVLIYLANSAPTPTELNTAANSPTNRVSGKPARKPLSQPWEEAREIWNGLRMVKKHYAAKRQAREADGPTSSPAPDYSDLNDLSIPIPAYMKELYWNISQHKTDDVETTTIRSLPARRTGNGELVATSIASRHHKNAPAHCIEC